MSQPLSICYFTNRQNARFGWFFASLRREIGAEPVRVVVVDFYQPIEARQKYITAMATKHGFQSVLSHVAPKPTVWQGQHKLTKDEWFAASNARNTALCHAPDGWIAFVDDLSVLLPGWFNCIKEAMAGNYIVCGAYKKVKELIVENGNVKSFKEFPGGIDTRWGVGSDSEAVPIDGGRMYGCSLAGPVEAFLQIGGFPESLCDGTGGEDYVAGIALENNGWKLKYDRRMVTFESEELHCYTVGTGCAWDESNPEQKQIVSSSFKRADYGISPNDKSHNILNQARVTKEFTNDLGGGFSNIRQLRDHVLGGGEFPIRSAPQHEWWSKRLLCEL